MELAPLASSSAMSANTSVLMLVYCNEVNLCLPKILSGANAFEISDIQEDETEAGLTRRSKSNNVTFVANR
jgi:hypothetical protein